MALPAPLQRYLITLGQFSWLPVVTLILGGAVGAFLAAKQAPLSQTFRYQGILSTTTPPAIFSETGAKIQSAGQILSPEVLLADNVVQYVASQLKEKPLDVQKAATVDVGSATDTSKIPQGAIVVKYSDTEEAKAKKGVALLMEAMREQSRLINAARLRTQIDAIKVRLPAVESELRTAEQNLEAYNRREEVNILAAQTGTLVGAITGSQQQQRQLRLSLEGVQAQITSLENRLGLSVDQAYISAALSADPIISNLRQEIYQTESQLALLQRDLRPDHPTIVDLQNRRSTYQKLLDQRAKEVIGGNGRVAPLSGSVPLDARQDSNLDPTRQQLANTLVSLKTQQETLQHQLDAAIETEQELRREYTTIPNKQLEQTRLAQDVALKKALFDKIQAALVDAQAAEAETSSSLQISQFPQFDQVIREQPVSKILLLGGGTLGGAGLGLGLVFALSLFQRQFMTTTELLGMLTAEEAPILGNLPILELEWTLPSPDRLETLLPSTSELPTPLPILLNPHLPYLDEYDKVRASLRRLGTGGAKVVVITSTGSQEGKTTIAYNLAIAVARAGKRSLVIEADLRRATVTPQLGVQLDPAEFITDYRNSPLEYYNTSTDCICPIPAIANLYVVPSPAIQRETVSILESREFQGLLRDCRGRFDFIVIDSPALGQFTDALLLESLADGIILTVRPRYTDKIALKDTLNLLEENQTPFLGAVINGAFPIKDHGLDMMETPVVDRQAYPLNS